MNAKRIALLVAILVCCAGVAGAQTEWVDHPDNPVIEIEHPGAWAPGGAWVNSALLDGSTYHVWFTGFTADGSYTEAGIGHATSSDGVEWTMDPANPILTRGPDGDWDDDLVLGPAVVRDSAGFHMWYTGGYDGDRQYLGYATSPDGSAWTKYADNPVVESGPPGAWDHIIGPSAVVVVDGTYRMWFYGSDGSDYNGQIGYAESDDGISWNKYPAPVLEPNRYPGSWEIQFLAPTVIFDGTTYHMWYIGNSPTEWGKAGYAFSADGIEWTQHRDNPVHGFPGQNIDPVVVLDGSTFHMWYGRFGLVGGPTTAYATSVCCPGVAALDNWRVIPAAAVASGAQGSFYQTDVDLNNASDQPADYEFMWLPRAEINTEPMTSEPFTLGPGVSVRYANVLSEVFSLEPNSLGALMLLSSSPDLLAMSRTYNNPEGDDAGTFGQAIPAVPPGDFIQTGERRRILFASENADLRFNVGCQNGDEGSTVVNLELFDHEGTSLGTEMMILRAWGNDQLNRIFEDYMPVIGYVDVWTTLQDKSFYCYGSVLDNVTSDPTTVLPQ